MNYIRPAVLCIILNNAALPAQDPAANEAARGEQLYLSQCSHCHGQNGEGGRGSSLNHLRLRQAPDDGALARVIRRGIADTGMPASSLTEQEVQLVAAHVRKLGRISASPAAGNAQRGEQLYQSKGGCPHCHTIQGRGAVFGPDLTSIGERRSPAYLRESLVSPGADISPGYFAITATVNDGHVITGVRVNEDTFSIQLRDTGNKLHSLWKAELKSLSKDLKKSLMPSYGNAFTAAELDDLVAYLAKVAEDTSR